MYLATSKAFDVIGQLHGGKVTVSTVSSKCKDRRHHKLMKMSSWWRPSLLSWSYPFSDHPRLLSSTIQMFEEKKKSPAIPGILGNFVKLHSKRNFEKNKFF